MQNKNYSKLLLHLKGCPNLRSNSGKIWSFCQVHSNLVYNAAMAVVNSFCKKKRLVLRRVQLLVAWIGLINIPSFCASLRNLHLRPTGNSSRDGSRENRDPYKQRFTAPSTCFQNINGLIFRDAKHLHFPLTLTGSVTTQSFWKSGPKSDCSDSPPSSAISRELFLPFPVSVAFFSTWLTCLFHIAKYLTTTIIFKNGSKHNMNCIRQQHSQWNLFPSAAMGVHWASTQEPYLGQWMTDII